MPTIAYFDGIRIFMHSNDHAPPHFHVVYAEFEASITIVGLAVEQGHLPNRVGRKVYQWANGRESELMQQWHKIRR